MKTRNKAILLSLCAILLVVTTVFATLAYLTDTENTVTNTFTVGNVSITLEESKVNTDGSLYDNGTTKVTSNEYKLFPGGTYTKDPVLTVDEGSEDAWVFVSVENQISAIEDSTNAIADQIIDNGWVIVDEDEDENVVIYAKSTAQKAGASLKVFDEFSVADTVNNAEFTALGNNTKIIINGYAIQADGFEDYNEAWAALVNELEA